MAGQRLIFCYSSFDDVLFWFLWEYSNSDMGRTSAIHRGDVLGLKTSMWWFMFYSVQSGSVCNSPILSDNIIYTRISTIWLLVSYYVHYVSTYVSYRVSYSNLYLHCRWHCRYLSWRGVDFLTAVSVYEHFDTVIFWLRVSYSFLLYILGVNVWEVH